MYNLNFDIWKFGHPQCANSANGALSELNVSNNKLTRGKWTNALNDNDRHDDNNYETDMSGLLALSEALKK